MQSLDINAAHAVVARNRNENQFHYAGDGLSKAGEYSRDISCVCGEEPRRGVPPETGTHLGRVLRRDRLGRVVGEFVYLCNGYSQTTATAFSVPARPGLGVSMPVSWDQLSSLKGGDQRNSTTAREYLSLRKGRSLAGLLEVPADADQGDQVAWRVLDLLAAPLGSNGSEL